jgi:hypothetical protein
MSDVGFRCDSRTPRTLGGSQRACRVVVDSAAKRTCPSDWRSSIPLHVLLVYMFTLNRMPAYARIYCPSYGGLAWPGFGLSRGLVPEKHIRR